jgi:acyl-homoserine lactone acylase PvdQ
MRVVLCGIAAGLACLAASGQPGAQPAALRSVEAARWAAEAGAVTLVRDDWGIAHVHGKTDADAVFGMTYAQAEDDFNRVERNYLTSLGRVAEADGEAAIWGDLRQRLFIDPEELKADYAASPAWLQQLMDAWADGLNFYLAQHPEVKPQVLTRFEPWMALSFTEGSIGGDIERVDLKQLEAFYGRPAQAVALPQSIKDAVPREDDNARALARLRNGDEEPSGSNGFAIAPSNTASHHALLLINPHTSFFFRSELQMTSDEGLNAYGAVTWGQFFVYQGFNDRAGWMHTSSGVDAVDDFLETVQGDAHGFRYRYGGTTRPMIQKPITLRYKSSSGTGTRTFTAYYTGHGPVVRADAGRWVTVELMNTPVKALEQSYLRTKARTYAEYRKTMELMANSSNNTLFADADGDIAYWHGNYIPRRDARFDYTLPVDGSDPATDWKGLLSLEEIPQLRNPKSGWLFNVNDSPWNGAGESSLRQADFPAYVEQGTESARGVHAMRVLTGRKDFTLESLRAAAYDSYLPWFAMTIPGLVKAYDALPAGDAKQKLREPIAVLRAWDFRWGLDSVATSLAVYWGETIRHTKSARPEQPTGLWEDYVAQHVPDRTKLTALVAAVDLMQNQFGGWKIPWGQINRFQRLTGDIVQPFNDARPSLAVPFTSSIWGSLASFGAKPYPGTKKWYGTNGNSFVAVVEFGDTVRARAVTAGGESGHPGSPHFDDEAGRYASGDLREVYFYPRQLIGHTRKTYHPGS